MFTQWLNNIDFRDSSASKLVLIEYFSKPHLYDSKILLKKSKALMKANTIFDKPKAICPFRPIKLKFEWYTNQRPGN